MFSWGKLVEGCMGSFLYFFFLQLLSLWLFQNKKLQTIYQTIKGKYSRDQRAAEARGISLVAARPHHVDIPAALPGYGWCPPFPSCSLLFRRGQRKCPLLGDIFPDHQNHRHFLTQLIYFPQRTDPNRESLVICCLLPPGCRCHKNRDLCCVYHCSPSTRDYSGPRNFRNLFWMNNECVSELMKKVYQKPMLRAMLLVLKLF